MYKNLFFTTISNDNSNIPFQTDFMWKGINSKLKNRKPSNSGYILEELFATPKTNK